VVAVIVSFAVRYLVNMTAFWLLDIRGVITMWQLGAGVLTGLYFPLAFLPGWAQAVLWLGTPFPAVFQAPIDILVERGGAGHRSLLLLDQVCWAVLLLVACALLQRRAERKLVVQGG
jgi:ABC-2 type transport system permease protein